MMTRYAVLNGDKTIDKYGDCQLSDLHLQAADGQIAIRINIDGIVSDELFVFDEDTNSLKPRNT